MATSYVREFFDSTSNRDVISLFSGAMGLDVGLMAAGLNVRVGQEVDASCVNAITANGHDVVKGDIREIHPETLLNHAGLRRGEPFLVCGGPPCQPFSTAGKRMGINDPRGSLFMDFKRMVEFIQPRFFIMENVKGLLSTPLTDEHNHPVGLKAFDVIHSELESIGYKLIFGMLDAVNYGVPQFRERLIVIGSRDNESTFLPMPTHFQTHQEPETRWRTLRDAISDLEENPGPCAQFSEDRSRYLDMVPEGGNWRSLPEEIAREAMGGAFASGGGKVGFFRRLSYDQPSPTLVTSPVQKATMLCHPRATRPLSLREYARIQQFPDDWIFSGKLTDMYKQVGNAVPVGLGTALGKALIATAEGSQTVKSKRIRGTSLHSKLQSALQTSYYSEEIEDYVK